MGCVPGINGVFERVAHLARKIWKTLFHRAKAPIFAWHFKGRPISFYVLLRNPNSTTASAHASSSCRGRASQPAPGPRGTAYRIVRPSCLRQLSLEVEVCAGVRFGTRLFLLRHRPSSLLISRACLRFGPVSRFAAEEYRFPREKSCQGHGDQWRPEATCLRPKPGGLLTLAPW